MTSLSKFKLSSFSLLGKDHAIIRTNFIINGKFQSAEHRNNSIKIVHCTSQFGTTILQTNLLEPHFVHWQSGPGGGQGCVSPAAALRE